MIKKVFGLIPILLGAVALLLSSEKTKKFLPVQLPSTLNSDIVFYVGCALLIVGALLLFGNNKSRKEQTQEVPVYEGKRIVAFRRV